MKINVVEVDGSENALKKIFYPEESQIDLKKKKIRVNSVFENMQKYGVLKL